MHFEPGGIYHIYNQGNTRQRGVHSEGFTLSETLTKA